MCINNEKNSKYHITYYSNKVFKEIIAWPVSFSGRYVALTEKMMVIGPNIGMPHTKALGKGLFEIRIKGQDGIARVFYCVKRNLEIVILHSFIKKTQQIPINELDIAKKRLQEVIKND